MFCASHESGWDEHLRSDLFCVSRMVNNWCCTLLFLGVKIILYIVCRRVPNPICRALANDHRNDVISNTAAVACGIIGEISLSFSFLRNKCLFAQHVCLIT